MSPQYHNISIVLCNTSHTGNIGSAARAMKTMGLTNLILVDPVVLPDDHSLALSCHAKDVVQNAKICTTLADAIADTSLAFGTTSRKREFNQRFYTPRESIPEILAAINRDEKVAIVFGSEKNGLSSEQAELCNRLLTIPGNPEYFSLNLASAVQIVAYELYCGGLNDNHPLMEKLSKVASTATFADNQGILFHLDDILQHINFYTKKERERTLRNLQHIVHKADLERQEVDLLRGIFKEIQRTLA